MVLVFVYITILIILLSPISVKVFKDDFKSYLEIRILYLIKFKIKKDKIEKVFNKFKDKNIDESINDFKALIKENKYIRQLLKKMTISKLKIIYYESFYDLNLKEAYIAMQAYSLIKSLNHSLFKKVKDENYYLMLKQNKDIYLDLNLSVNTFYLIYYSILIMIKKRSYVYERSWKFFKN